MDAQLPFCHVLLSRIVQTACSIFVYFSSSFFSKHFVKLDVVQPYNSYMVTAWKNSWFILSKSDLLQEIFQVKLVSWSYLTNPLYFFSPWTDSPTIHVWTKTLYHIENRYSQLFQTSDTWLTTSSILPFIEVTKEIRKKIEKYAQYLNYHWFRLKPNYLAKITESSL